MGVCYGSPILKDCLDYYEKNEFVIPQEIINKIVTSSALLGKVLMKYGYLRWVSGIEKIILLFTLILFYLTFIPFRKENHTQYII